MRELEEPVRRFVSGARVEDEDGDEEMEEVVFAGRREREGGWKRARREVRGEVEAGMVFEPVGGDDAAAVKYVSLPNPAFLRVLMCEGAGLRTPYRTTTASSQSP